MIEETLRFTGVPGDYICGGRILLHSFLAQNPLDFARRSPSLSQLACWLGEKAEELGVEIYPGFAASEILYDDEKVIGIATNDMGIAKDGSRRDYFQCGVELKGRITLLGEGCRGSLSEKIMKKYNLREKVQGQHQTYALGIKETHFCLQSAGGPGTGSDIGLIARFCCGPFLGPYFLTRPIMLWALFRWISVCS